MHQLNDEMLLELGKVTAAAAQLDWDLMILQVVLAARDDLHSRQNRAFMKKWTVGGERGRTTEIRKLLALRSDLPLDKVLKVDTLLDEATDAYERRNRVVHDAVAAPVDDTSWIMVNLYSPDGIPGDAVVTQTDLWELWQQLRRIAVMVVELTSTLYAVEDTHEVS